MPHLSETTVHRLAILALVLLAPSLVHGEEPLRRSPRLPDSTPWDVESLGRAPGFEWVDAEGPVRSLLYDGERYRDRATRVFAYYASPATLGDDRAAKPYPAVVLIHGGGGTAFREWTELWAKRGYAAIAMDLAGSRPVEGANPHDRKNRTRLPDGGPGQGDDEKFGSVDEEPGDQWPYHAVANVVRAHSLIRSFDDVDETRTAVTGISWGGYLTCIVAGVDHRFDAAVPVYGCGFLHENSAWVPRFGRMTAAQRERWTTLWDPSKYLPAVSMPILFVNGTNDFAYPLDSYGKSYDAVPGTKAIRITVKMNHSHPAGWAPTEIGRFVDQHLREGPPLPTLGKPKLAADGVTVPWTGRVKVVNAALHHTTDTKAINARDWTTTEGRVGNETATTPAPPKDATAWFVTVTDESGAIVSTPVVIRQAE